MSDWDGWSWGDRVRLMVLLALDAADYARDRVKVLASNARFWFNSD